MCGRVVITCFPLPIVTPSNLRKLSKLIFFTTKQIDKTNQKECLELEEIFGENYAADEIVAETLRVGASFGEYELMYSKRRT